MTSVLIILNPHRKTLEQVDPLLFRGVQAVLAVVWIQKKDCSQFTLSMFLIAKKDSLLFQFNTLGQTAVALMTAKSFSGLKRVDFS